MAYKIASYCGGLRYNTDSFKEVDGILTAIDANEDSVEPIVAGCGLLIDGQEDLFKVVRVDNKPVIALQITDDEDVTSYFSANCSVLFDANSFELGEDKEVIIS